jgi:hypothetical protein
MNPERESVPVVTDSTNSSGLQPRVPVAERVEQALNESGRTDDGLIIGYTYRALAAKTYETQNPTAAQLSAVRRTVAKLVASGRAFRSTERFPSWLSDPWRVDLPTSFHRRRGVAYADPSGVCIFRRPTESDIAANRINATWLED